MSDLNAYFVQANARFVVVFDEECGLCQSSVRWLKKRDRFSILEYSPLQQSPILRALGLTEQEALAQIHVVNRAGVVKKGADAILWILEQLPRFHWLKVVKRIPGMLAVLRFGYRFIAKRRKRNVCAGSCRY